MKRKKRRKIKRVNLIIYLLILTFIVLFWVNYQSKKVDTLYSQEYNESIETNALIIKNEELVTLNNSIDFNVKEGQRVSKNQGLSDTIYSSIIIDNTNDLDIINNLIDNNLFQEENLFQKDIEDIDEELLQIENDIKWSNTFKDSDKVANLNKRKEELLQKKEEILSSFKYIGLDKESLIELKDKYMSQSSTKDSVISLDNLNFDFPGYIFFESDGYEKSLNANILAYITPDYINDLESYYNKIDNNSGQTIKIIDDSYLYLTIIVPTDTLLSQESKTIDKKNNLLKILNTDDLNMYYQYLNNRVDALRLFPTVTLEYDETNKINGYLIDSRDYGEYKLLILELKDEIPQELLSMRKNSFNIFTYKDYGYTIPKKSLVNMDSKDYIVVLNKGYLKKYIEVNISKETENMYFLDKSDNPDITDGMQLILNP